MRCQPLDGKLFQIEIQQVSLSPGIWKTVIIHRRSPMAVGRVCWSVIRSHHTYPDMYTNFLYWTQKALSGHPELSTFYLKDNMLIPFFFLFIPSFPKYNQELEL